MKKNIISAVVVFCLVAVLTAYSSAAAFQVKVDGKEVVFSDVQPRIVDGYKYVPVRFAEALGYSVSWDGQNKTAIVEANGQILKCKVGSNTAVVKDENGKYKTVKIFIEKGRVLVPIDFLTIHLQAKALIEY